MLAVEVDGDIHKNRKDYDEYKDEFLQSIGITTLRFMNEDVVNNIDKVLDKIRKSLIL
jgi:very-short-patch-repair endonuclease